MRAFVLSGQTSYPEAVAAMERLIALRLAGRVPDVLLILEHAPVITIGRARGAAEHVIDAGEVPVVEVSRGGDVTLHGPGQLVAYPILLLPEGRRDLIKHMRALEDAVIELLGDLGVHAGRDSRNTGVWVPDDRGPARKVCAVGIACRRWVTWHGLALNLHIDVAGFARIHPCGFAPDTVTRLADHLDPCPHPAELAAPFAPYLSRHLQVGLQGPAEAVDGLPEVFDLLGVPSV